MTNIQIATARMLLAYDTRLLAEWDAWWNALSPEEQAEQQLELDASTAEAAERNSERFLLPGYGCA
jgi:hypothetical protein